MKNISSNMHADIHPNNNIGIRNAGININISINRVLCICNMSNTSIRIAIKVLLLTLLLVLLLLCMSSMNGTSNFCSVVNIGIIGMNKKF